MATALAAPFAVVMGMHSASAFDCDDPYGAHQGGNATDATCNDVGLHARIPNGKPYTVSGKIANAGSGPEAVVLCDGAKFAAPLSLTGQDTADTADSVVQTGGTVVLGLADSAGRNVGYAVLFPDGTSGTVTVNCLDDHAKFSH